MNRRIIVDADACPIKQEIIQVGLDYSVPVIFVASFAHFMNDFKNAKIYYVDSFSQSVDLFIFNLVRKGDIVITGDYGLASVVLKPDVKVISYRGLEYNQDNIDLLLESRHYTLKQKYSGGKIKGPKKFTDLDRKKFVEKLEEILNN